VDQISIYWSLLVCITPVTVNMNKQVVSSSAHAFCIHDQTPVLVDLLPIIGLRLVNHNVMQLTVVIGQQWSLVMVALCNRADHYIFAL